MEKLKADLAKMIDELQDAEEFRERLNHLIYVYPFNEYEYVISVLLGVGILKIDDYYELRDDYIARNMYLYIFEISAPRNFGENWAQGHLKELIPSLQKPSKKVDPHYSGQYDFLLQNTGDKIRIEVKASRAVDSSSEEALYVKALSLESNEHFDMNFQQIKPQCCDVFVWIAVWRDKIRYWVLTSQEIENNRHYSGKQHRGNIGEGQLHLRKDNIEEFKNYEVSSNELLSALLQAYKRQTGQ